MAAANLDVRNISMLSFLDFLYEEIDNIFDQALSMEQVIEILNKYNSTVEPHSIDTMKAHCKIGVKKFVDSVMPDIDLRLNEMKAVVEAKPKRKIAIAPGKYDHMDSDKLMKMVEEKLTESLKIKTKETKKINEEYKKEIEEERAAWKATIESVDNVSNSTQQINP